MALTYDPIATTTLGANANSVTLSSIPSTYTDLVLVIVGTATAANNMYLQYNGDTGTNYSKTFMYGDGTTAASGRDSSQTSTNCGYFDTGQGNVIVHIQNYANTTTFKTALSRGNAAGTATSARALLWRSTAAINSIKVFLQTENFTSGSSFTLYGITAA